MPTEVDFYFDIVCPFAYLASHQINQLCAQYNITPTWKPVLLAGLYEFSKAPQGKKNSATTVMIPVKRLYNSRDATWQKHRLNVKQKYPKNWPTKTLQVQRLLTAIKNNNDTMQCAKRLYHDLWVKNKDLTDITYLTQVASDYNVDVNVINDPLIKQKLKDNTRNAAEKYNMFGVPAVVVRIGGKEHFFWGIDRFPLVDVLLRDGFFSTTPTLRLMNTVPDASQNVIEFFFDFASPYSFLGYMRLPEFEGFADKIVLKPVLLGAMFAHFGNISPALRKIGPAKRKYQNMDFMRSFETAGVRVKMNSNFPVRSILALRVFIVDIRTIDCIFKACWQSNVNIGDKNELKKVLDRNGFDGEELILQARRSKKVKQKLRNNTDFAIEKGMFGVPTYVVNKDYDRFCWGQDRMYFVKDLCCGWEPPIMKKSNL